MTKNEILESLGVQDTTAFDAGKIVRYVYKLGKVEVEGYIQYNGRRLTTSILSIFSPDRHTDRHQLSQDGFRAFWRFYKKSRQLTRMVNAQELEMLAIAVINKDILRFLIKQGFTTKQVTIPKEIIRMNANQVVECYSKTTDMR